MSLKKTLVLALLLLIFAAYILKIQIPAFQEAQTKDLIFKDLQAARLESLEIIRPQDSFKLKNTAFQDNQAAIENDPKVNVRSYDEWQLDDLPGAKIETVLINSLITSIRDLKLDDKLPKEDIEADLSIYGLQDPALVIRLRGQSEREITLGKINQYLNKRYLKLSQDENIYLISEGLYSAADKSRQDFRAKTPLNFMDSNLESIELIKSESKIKLTRDEDRKWQISLPAKTAASSESVLELTRTIRNLRVADFIDDVSLLPQYNLSNPQLKVLLEIKNEKGTVQEELNFAKATSVNNSEDKYYLYMKDSPSIFQLTANPFMVIDKSLLDLRERKMYEFAVDDVYRALVEYADGSELSLFKEGLSWKVNGEKGDDIFIDQWLNNLAELEADDFPVQTQDFGFENPLFKLSLSIKPRGADSEVLKSLIIGSNFYRADKTKGYYALSDEGETPFIISEESYKKVYIREEALLAQNVEDEATVGEIEHQH